MMTTLPAAFSGGTPPLEGDLPRGIRNNNPGNIKYDGTPWQGLGAPPSDGAFCRFIDAKHGIRAMAKLISNYGKKYGLKSIRQIISRWAPANENDTESYVNAVSRELMRTPDEPLNLSNQNLLVLLCKSIIRHENGKCPYSDEEIREGIEL